MIFSADSNHPGAGYRVFRGAAYRIAGTTEAGVDDKGNPKPLAGAHYYYASGDPANVELIVGEEVDVAEYMAWVDAPHEADVAGSPPSPSPLLLAGAVLDAAVNSGYSVTAGDQAPPPAPDAALPPETKAQLLEHVAAIAPHVADATPEHKSVWERFVAWVHSL